MFCFATRHILDSHLHRDALALDFTCCSNGGFAAAISPDRKRNKKKIKKDKYCHVRLAADTESIAMQTFAQNKIHTVPRHQHSEKTNNARNCQTELRPPTCEPAVQRQDITKQRN